MYNTCLYNKIIIFDNIHFLYFTATQPCGVDCGDGQCVTEDGTNKCVCPNGMQYDGTSCSSECTIVKWYIHAMESIYVKPRKIAILIQDKHMYICTLICYVWYLLLLWPCGYFKVLNVKTQS